MFIYVTGPLEGLNDLQKNKNRQALDLVNRRILLAKHIPLCPVLITENWRRDPRFLSDQGWWVFNIFKPIMSLCSHFCYVPFPANTSNERFRMEKELWNDIGTGIYIRETNIFNFLTEGA